MIAVLTQTEAIVFAVLGLFYLAAILTFIRALKMGELRPIWRRLRIGVFVERDPNGRKEE